MKIMVKTILMLALAVIVTDAFAIPANPQPRMLIQPDGSKFQATLKGDEHFSFAEDEDGFSIICRSDGWWTYAKQQDGLLVPTEAKAGIDNPPHQRHLRPNADAIAALPKNQGKMITTSPEFRNELARGVLYGAGGTKEEPKLYSSAKATGPKGKRYINILLGDFTDSTFSYFSGKVNPPAWPPMPKDTYRHLLTLVFGDRDSAKPIIYDSTSSPSLTNFYLDMSMQKMYFACDYSGAQILGVDTIRMTTYSWSGANANETQYMMEVAANADPHVNFRDPVTGGQTVVGVIHPGPCETESGRTGDIWSSSYSGFSVATGDGVTVRTMFICPQGAMLGVFAHECFHGIGGPDLYDYGYSGNPWGEWSLMDMGAYNGPHSGDQPSFAGGHLQYDIDGNLSNGITGWLDSANVYTDSISSARNGDGRYTIAALDSSGEARRGNITSGIRLWRVRNNAFRDSTEVFFVENRRRTPPYEVGLPEEGLIITHINTRMADVSPNFNSGPPVRPYYCSWVEQPGINPNWGYAIGDSSFSRTTSTAAYSANDFNSIGNGETAIDSLSTPNCLVNGGTTAGFGKNGPWIYNISGEGIYMTFNVARTGLAASTPLVGYVSYVLTDPVITGTANNNNGLMDPWENDSIKVRLRNTGKAITAGAQCSLYVVTGSAYITVTNPGWKTVGTGALALNAEATSLKFGVAITKDVPRFTDVVFGVKFKSTTPVYSATCNFGGRISGLVVTKVYDFQNIRVGGTTFDWRIMPSDVALLGDTLFLCNANLDHDAFQTRIYAVRKNTANNPLVPGPGGDTIRSINNRGNVHVTAKYGGGLDIGNDGRLWISLADSVFSTNRSTKLYNYFKAPNVDKAGTPAKNIQREVPLKWIRGIAMGPAVIDTVGPDPISGDSLWAYWQDYETFSESLLVIGKPASGLAVRRYGYSWDETVYGAAYGGQWWNGRALEYDGSNIWTSSVDVNYLIRRSPVDGQLIDLVPGPSTSGDGGLYGLAIEATNGAGVPYAPVGTAAYVPGAEGNRFYLYCAARDEGKIYKVDITSMVVPTSADSMKVVVSGVNTINWWKANVDAQKVYQYIVYRQPAGSTTPPLPADEIARVRHIYGAGTANTYTDVVGGAYVYEIKPVNYYGPGGIGGYINIPIGKEAGFKALISGNNVCLQWANVSGGQNNQWQILRSIDGINYQQIAAAPGPGIQLNGNKYSYTDLVETDGVYCYQLYKTDEGGQSHLSGQLMETIGRVPLNYELRQNCPNPVSGGVTKVNFALKNPGKVSLAVYNVLGEKVKTLADGTRRAGFYTVSWNGADDKGRQVSNGIYFYKLASGNFEAVKKMVILR